MTRRAIASFFFFVFVFSGISIPAAFGTAGVSEIPVKGMVTLVDIGSESCTPCKMMVPVLREMQEKYKGKAAIIVLDVGRDRDKSRPFSLRIVPTQIFFDKDGKEVSRHEGFMDQKGIMDALEKLGVEK
ncbi:MAG: thioredoxin family protein [Syntrophobacteraceae bacterium]